MIANVPRKTGTNAAVYAEQNAHSSRSHAFLTMLIKRKYTQTDVKRDRAQSSVLR